MHRGWDKFRLLIWKNWLLQRRHKLQTSVEILAPVIFATLMVLVRSLVEPKMVPTLNFEPFPASKFFLPPSMGNSTSTSGPASILQYRIAYSPDTPLTKNVLIKSLRYLLLENLGIVGNLIPISRYINGFANSTEMLMHLTDPLSNDTNMCGIKFDDSMIDLTDWPNNMNLTLHFPAELRAMGIQAHFYNWKTNFLFPLFQTPGPRSPKEKTGGWPGYVKEGFMPLAHAILRQLTIVKSEKLGLDTNWLFPQAMSYPQVEIQRFPHPSFLSDDLLTALRGFISIIIMLSFNYTCINTVKVIATEKERQLKEVMKVMGLDNWLHWTAWFIKTFSYVMITVILIIILLKVEWYGTKDGLSGYSVFTFTPWHFILVFLMVYMGTSICFCFMISVFFSRANTAATVAGMMWFLSYAPYMFLANDLVLPSLGVRMISSLASNTAMAFGFEIILANEATAEGLQWSKIWTPTTTDDPFVMGHVLIMLVVDAFLYLLIALYVEQVFPGSYGVPQPWYFPVSGEYWRSTFRCMADVEDIPRDSNYMAGDGAIEPDPKGLNVGINIINLTKIYNKKVAVDKLNFKIFEDQITVLLGHNGAGKTTTMSMLTGIFPPTLGTALVAGHDIRHDVAGVRASLGICPQHNVLFPDLTVAEHIYFYARLKGITGSLLTQEVDKYVSLLGLWNKRDVLASSLSGGMQRRLSVGAALCGGSKVVLLDEPSSGMDPSARRELWDLLHTEKKGRTMILSTHFMDEAEVLGERVAIMSGGRLKAVGSPFHLKKKFGAGYRLTAATRGLPSAPVTTLIRRHIPQATLYSDIGSELCYLLPAELSGLFEPMLKELETKQFELGLNSFGISATTLEDVFMKVGADAVEVVDDQDQITYKESDTNDVLVVGSMERNGHPLENPELANCSEVRYTGVRLYVDQWGAMLYKKMVTSVRTWLLALLQLFIPVLFLIIAIMVSRMWQTSANLPARNLTLSEGYQDSVTLLSHTADNLTMLRKDMYREYFTETNISSMKVVDISNDSIEDYYLKQAKYDMPQMRVRNLAGATLNSTAVKVWFSNFAYHDLPVSMMLVYNAILKSVSPNSSFSLINQPLPYSLQTQLEMLNYGDNAGFQIAFNIGFSMAFVSAFYVLFYIKENVCRSKLLQLASGASPLILWGAAFIWDMFSFLIIDLALCITLAVSKQSGFSTAAEIGRVFSILLLFGWGMLPIHFLAAHFFQTPSTGFSRMCLFNIFTGVATFLVVEVLNAPGLDLEYVANILHWFFLIIPNYALCGSLKNLYEASVTIKGCLAVCELQQIPNCTQYTICESNPAFKRCCISDHPYFEWEKPGVGAHVTYMILTGIVMFLVLLIKEYRISSELLRCLHRPPPLTGSGEEDSDVAEERTRVDNLPQEQYVDHSLVCKDMSKYYKNFLAVNQISLAVKSGECFGLLGINGAGKTTTFKMLTGDLDISSGGAWVAGHSVNKDMKTVYNSIGYCPQFDALLDEMTGRETLIMFARLRGIPPLQQQRYVWDLSKRLGFVKHLDKKVREYSGGNKRKLSTSLALLGDPQVVYLDEPTTGMDPMAKRQVWRAVAGRQTGSVVLTSHSMEECEALCTRLAIMVNGRFCCLGSTQHLKNKFSQGYTLIAKLRRQTHDVPDLLPSLPSAPPDSAESFTIHPPSSPPMFNTEPLHLFLTQKFPGAQLKESYQGLMTYYLPDATIMWSTIFGVMETAKASLNIEDYSIGQTSLEQIFLQFTKDQRAHKDD